MSFDFRVKYTMKDVDDAIKIALKVPDLKIIGLRRPLFVQFACAQLFVDEDFHSDHAIVLRQALKDLNTKPHIFLPEDGIFPKD